VDESGWLNRVYIFEEEAIKEGILNIDLFGVLGVFYHGVHQKLGGGIQVF
jgi:hypothetical protein